MNAPDSKKAKNLHVFSTFPDKYTKKLYEFFSVLEGSENYYFIFEKKGSETVLPGNVFWRKGMLRKRLLFAQMFLSGNYRKVIFHGYFFGLLDFAFIAALAILFRKKTDISWFAWGADLYSHLYKNIFFDTIFGRVRYALSLVFKKCFFKQLRFLITPIQGDYELARKWFGLSAEYVDLPYPNPVELRRTFEAGDQCQSDFVVMVGNSADQINNHVEILGILSKFRRDIKIYCPLSYGGTSQYVSDVIAYGKSQFGNSFLYDVDFLSPDEYRQRLEKVKVAVFFHDRQQAVGNIIQLLYMGKKVFIKNYVTTYAYLEKIGLPVFDATKIGDMSYEDFVVNNGFTSAVQMQIDSIFGESLLKEKWGKFLSGC